MCQYKISRVPVCEMKHQLSCSFSSFSLVGVQQVKAMTPQMMKQLVVGVQTIGCPADLYCRAMLSAHLQPAPRSDHTESAKPLSARSQLCNNPGPYTVPQSPQGTDLYLLQLSMDHRLCSTGQEFIHTSPLLPHHGFLGWGGEVQRGQEVCAVGQLLVNGLAAELLLHIHQQLPLPLVFFPLGDSYIKQVLITSLEVYS